MEGAPKENKAISKELEVGDCTCLCFSTTGHRPSLPEDIIALGDPQPLPQILNIGSPGTPAPPPVTLEPLSMDVINEIFNRVIGRSVTR